MAIDRLHCGSKSTTRTSFPARPSASAKFQQIVDLPTPPLLLNTEINLGKANPFVRTNSIANVAGLERDGHDAWCVQFCPFSLEDVAARRVGHRGFSVSVDNILGQDGAPTTTRQHILGISA